MTQLIISKSNAYDPNWFLSTTAQSTAALVAIIGGFLISRLISTVAEKSQQIQSLAELRNSRRVKDAEFGKFQKTVTDVTHKWFRDENLKAIVESMGDTNYTKMVDDFKTMGSERKDIAEYANILKGVVTRAFKELNDFYKSPSTPPDTSKEMRADGISIVSEHDEEIFESVAIHISNASKGTQIDPELQRNRNFAFQNLSDVPTTELIPGAPDIVFERHIAALKERDRLNEELGVIDGEIALLDSRLHTLTQPKRLIQGFIILAYFSIVGIVYPLFLMTRNPVVTSASSRSLVLFGFISGLIALLVFILRAVADLRVIVKNLTGDEEKPS